MKKAFTLAGRASYIVIYPFDGTYNHPTYFAKKMAELRNSKQILEFDNRKCCLTERFKGFFSFSSKETSIRGYILLKFFSLIAVFSFFSKDVSIL